MSENNNHDMTAQQKQEAEQAYQKMTTAMDNVAYDRSLWQDNSERAFAQNILGDIKYNMQFGKEFNEDDLNYGYDNLEMRKEEYHNNPQKYIARLKKLSNEKAIVNAVKKNYDPTLVGDTLVDEKWVEPKNLSFETADAEWSNISLESYGDVMYSIEEEAEKMKKEKVQEQTKEKSKRPVIYAKSAEVRELHNQSNEAVKEAIGDNPANAIQLMDTADKYNLSIRNAALVKKGLKERNLNDEALKSYEDWQKDNLQVKKGQKGIPVIEPRTDDKGNIAMTKVTLFPASATNAKKESLNRLAEEQFTKSKPQITNKWASAKQLNSVAKYYHLPEDAQKDAPIKDNINNLVDKYLVNRDSFAKYPNEKKNTEAEKILVKNSFIKRLNPYKDVKVTENWNQQAADSLAKWTNKDGKHFTELDGKEQAKILTSAMRTYNKLTYGMQRTIKLEKAQQQVMAKKQEMGRE